MSDLPTATQLIDGLKWYIDKARSYGYRIYVGTLLPIRGWRTYAPFREDLKNEFNEFNDYARHRTSDPRSRTGYLS